MGLVYPDCEEEVKHVPVYSEIIIRDPVSYEVVNDGEVGLIQLLTPIPHSYPGNSLITDDLGTIVGRQK